jgi:hypothetical protein
MLGILLSLHHGECERTASQNQPAPSKDQFVKNIEACGAFADLLPGPSSRKRHRLNRHSSSVTGHKSLVTMGPAIPSIVMVMPDHRTLF